MVINVGLLIHHKVNLQNSADLAAYYGAMKQAEVLNAMAHVNYQIRQSWKLFVWRYRILGTYGHKLSSGANSLHPANLTFYTTSSPNMARFEGPAASNRLNEGRNGHENWYKRPLFCISHQGIGGWPPENLCKVDARTVDEGQAFHVRNPPNIAVIAGHIASGMAISVNSAIEQLREQNHLRCDSSRRTNYALASTMLFSFQADQAVRKATFKKLYGILTEASKDSASARDLNNESMAEGAFQTLINNLTEPNRSSIGDRWNSPKGSTEFEISFGLGDPSCENFADGNAESSAFAALNIFPDIYYLGSTCTSSGSNNAGNSYQARHLSDFNSPADNCSATNGDAILEYACRMKNLVYANQGDLQMSLGYSKNPKCLPYTGVKVATTPKIPFMPTEIKLTARSYAQAFGGSIGPAWSKKYAEIAANTNTSSKIESNLSPVLISGTTTVNSDIQNAIEGANYSKYPGDLVGLGSDPVYVYYSALLSQPEVRKPSLMSWQHIVEGNYEDMLISGNTELRQLEISSIVPNLFDITYYSIEPDFYNLYYTKIIKRIGPTVPIDGLNTELDIRPDIGSKKENNIYTNYSIRNQLKEIEGLVTKSIPNLPQTMQQAFPWMVTNQGNLLTSWNFSKFGDYVNNPNDSDFWKNYLGVCWEDAARSKQVDNDYLTDSEMDPATNSLKAPTPGNCITGGRTGFSVRLVNEKFLTETFKAKLPNGWE